MVSICEHITFGNNLAVLENFEKKAKICKRGLSKIRIRKSPKITSRPPVIRHLVHFYSESMISLFWRLYLKPFPAALPGVPIYRSHCIAH